MVHTVEDHRIFKGKRMTQQINNWSLAHPVSEDYISYQPVTNRANRRHFQDIRRPWAMTKKTFIPKEEQQPGGNIPYRNPDRAVRKARQRAERLARRG